MSLVKELKTPVGVATAVLVVVLLVLFVLMGFGASRSVCTVCGCERTTEHFLYFPHSTMEATPLSEFLLKNGIVPGHKHEWLPVRGAGFGGFWTGRGYELHFTIGNPMVTGFLENVLRYRGKDECRKYARCFLDRRTTSASAGTSAGGAASRDEFEELLRWDEGYWRWAFAVVGIGAGKDTPASQSAKRDPSHQ